MKERGISSTAVVVIAVVCIAIGAGLSYIILTQKGPGAGFPEYPGATLSALPAKYGSFASADTASYTVGESPAKVVNWYVTQLSPAGWTEVADISFNNSRLLVCSKGNELAVILVSEGILIVARGTTTVFQQIDQSIPQLTIPTTPVIRDVTVAGGVYDWNATGAENYRNGDLFLTITVVSGGLRDVGDPTYGFTIQLVNPRTGWSGTITQPSGGFVADYGTIKEWITTFAVGGQTATATISVPTSQAGMVAVGSAITIRIDVPSTAQTATATESWTERDTINVTITGRDPFSKTGFDGAYLIGIAYTT